MSTVPLRAIAVAVTVNCSATFLFLLFFLKEDEWPHMLAKGYMVQKAGNSSGAGALFVRSEKVQSCLQVPIYSFRCLISPGPCIWAKDKTGMEHMCGAVLMVQSCLSHSCMDVGFSRACLCATWGNQMVLLWEPAEMHLNHEAYKLLAKKPWVTTSVPPILSQINKSFACVLRAGLLVKSQWVPHIQISKAPL